MKNIVVRACSGAVYVALIVCSILYGKEWAFPLLGCLFVFAGIMEFQKMVLTNFYESPRILFVDLLVGLCLPVAVAFMPYSAVLYIASLILAMVLCMIRFVMALYSHRPDVLRHTAYSVLSVVYLSIPVSMALLVQQWLGNAVALLMFVMIWLNDTGAFIVGSAMGCHRLFPRLSPKKSWEGFFGGMLFCILAGPAAKMLFQEEFAHYSVYTLAVWGVVVCVMATWGDLFESMIKRSVGVKDSGNLIPGHGGILDRIDSLLFVAPATALFFVIYFSQYLFTPLVGA